MSDSLTFIHHVSGQSLDISTIPCQLKAGRFQVKLAETLAEKQQVMALRQRVFFANNPTITTESRDDFAHHLMVYCNKTHRVVGSMRLILRGCLPASERFYAEDYYAFDHLLDKREAVEISRFCIDEAYRSGAILMLLWKATQQYLDYFKVELMFGIASFPGQNPLAHQGLLRRLYQQHLAPSVCMPSAIHQTAISLSNWLANVTDDDPPPQIPPLMKLYLKMNARVSDHFYVDPVFNSCFVMLYVERCTLDEYTRQHRTPANRKSENS